MLSCLHQVLSSQGLRVQEPAPPPVPCVGCGTRPSHPKRRAQPSLLCGRLHAWPATATVAVCECPHINALLCHVTIAAPLRCWWVQQPPAPQEAQAGLCSLGPIRKPYKPAKHRLPPPGMLASAAATPHVRRDDMGSPHRDASPGAYDEMVGGGCMVRLVAACRRNCGGELALCAVALRAQGKLHRVHKRAACSTPPSLSHKAMRCTTSVRACVHAARAVHAHAHVCVCARFACLYVCIPCLQTAGNTRAPIFSGCLFHTKDASGV